MRNYLTAECYKVFRRKDPYLTLLVVLALEGVLLWGCWLTSSWGNEGMNFYSAATLVAVMLSIGVYAPLLTCDMVFSEQYKQNTLKNEVAYGLPRAQPYQWMCEPGCGYTVRITPSLWMRSQVMEVVQTLPLGEEGRRPDHLVVDLAREAADRAWGRKEDPEQPEAGETQA